MLGICKIKKRAYLQKKNHVTSTFLFSLLASADAGEKSSR